MNADKLILAGAVAFAGVLVAQKMGVFKVAALTSGPWPSLTFRSDTAFTESPDEQGYDPEDPGKYVMVEDLIKGVGDNDWGYMPTKFFQSADSILNPNFFLNR